jgi:hypothetical protein
MRTFGSIIAVLALTLALAGCGGGGSCNNLNTGGTNSSSTSSCATTNPGGGIASLAVSSSAATIPADGSSTATITVLAKDANNNAVSGVAVTLAASAGTLTVASPTTDSTGTVTATLSGSGVPANTAVNVTASSGSVTGKATVTVTQSQQSLTALTSLAQIPSDGSKSATITALVRDAKNNVVPGVTVGFQASSGALTVTQAVTDATGLASATLTAGADPTDRSITITASVGSATSQVTVAVTGTTLSLACPPNLVLNSTANCSATLANSAAQGISGTTVMVSSAKSNTLSGTTLTTDGSGRVTFTLLGVNGGTDTVTATSLGLSQQTSVAVSTQSFNITAPASGTNVTLGTAQQVTVTWLNNGVPVANQPVAFAATRGTIAPPATLNTDANGHATISITSNSAGSAIVQASGSGVATQTTLNFIAGTPSQISTQPSPAAVAVQGQSTITATVRDANNNLVQGATVNFQLVTDPTNGSLSVASATTNAQGQAQTVYTAGNSSSGANGVSISATIGGTAITNNALLTVGGQAAFLSLGTGNTIDTGQGVAVYQITYSVFAVDSHGASLANVPITVSILPVSYGKGTLTCPTGAQYWGPNYSTSTADAFAYNGTKRCVNEDTDYTGNIASLDSGGAATTCVNLTNGQTITSHAKDYNCDGQLEPGNVAVVAPSSGMTDATGRLDVKVTYPRDHSYWVQVKLVASTQVSGTQSSTSSTFVLQGATTDYGCTTGPPGPVSPYGVAMQCIDPR